MKADSQRIAIAEFCGWKPGVANVGPNHEKVAGYWYGGRFHVRDPGEHPLPDYINCLNAMRIVLLRLSDEAAISYRCVLTQMAVDRRFDPIMAAAGHQAEAFLKVIGKWADDES